MGCPVCTNSFPGESHIKLYFVVLEGVIMHKHKKSLFMQDSPDNSSVPRTSHRFKFKPKWRKTVFRLVFRALEVLLVILQIIQCFCEMFKK